MRNPKWPWLFKILSETKDLSKFCPTILRKLIFVLMFVISWSFLLCLQAPCLKPRRRAEKDRKLCPPNLLMLIRKTEVFPEVLLKNFHLHLIGQNLSHGHPRQRRMRLPRECRPIMIHPWHWVGVCSL